MHYNEPVIQRMEYFKDENCAGYDRALCCYDKFKKKNKISLN